jgi:hypothetical protein
MSCNTAGISPAQASLVFFPGTRGEKGDKGDPGDPSEVPGPPGATGPFGVYTGPFVAGTVYYDNEFRKDLVSWNGRIWATNNSAKNGLTTWDFPTIADWGDAGTTLKSVATALELIFDADISVALTFLPTSFLQSENFVQYVSGWLLTGNGRLEAYDALIAGFISTNTPKFNVADDVRTMPGVAQVSFDIGPLADGDIPVNPTIEHVTDDTLIFFGWTQGDPVFIENRFGNEAQKFDISIAGIGQNDSAGTDLFYIQVYYRTRENGGAWGLWTVIGQDAYMNKLAGQDQSFSFNRPLNIALTGVQDIQFWAERKSPSGRTTKSETR